MTGPAVIVSNAGRPYGRKLSVNDPVIIALFVSDKTSLQLQHTQYWKIIVHLCTTRIANSRNVVMFPHRQPEV